MAKCIKMFHTGIYLKEKKKTLEGNMAKVKKSVKSELVHGCPLPKSGASVNV